MELKAAHGSCVSSPSLQIQIANPQVWIEGGVLLSFLKRGGKLRKCRDFEIKVRTPKFVSPAGKSSLLPWLGPSNFQDFPWNFSSLEAWGSVPREEGMEKGWWVPVNLSVAKGLQRAGAVLSPATTSPLLPAERAGFKLHCSSESVQFAGIRWQPVTLEYGAIPGDLQSPSPDSLED